MKRLACVGLLFLIACKEHPEVPKIVYLKISGIHLAIPDKFAPRPPPISREGADDCREAYEDCVAHPPGGTTIAIRFIEQNFHSFERYKSSDHAQGLSDSVGFSIRSPESITKGGGLPNFASAWDPKNRDAANDIYGLKAYSAARGDDDVNYQFDFDPSTRLFMTCKHFYMPNPGCIAVTTWRGLQIEYDFRHRHLAKWRDLHERLIKHLDSFVYQP